MASLPTYWGRWAAAAVLLLLGGCDLLEFSPQDTQVPAEYRNLTQKNLARLAARPLPAGDTLRVVFTGDSQRFYDAADALVASVNQQPGIALVVVAGDISDFGLGREMQWVARRLARLRVPYLTVIGNHDHVGNGRAAYEQVFGPLNYSFIHGDPKFVFVDTNSREYGFNGQIPDLNWLRPQLGEVQGAARQVVVAHVPPQDADFDARLTRAYAAAVAAAPGGRALHLSGHRHRYAREEPFGDGVTYVNTEDVGARQYLVLTLWTDTTGQARFRVRQVNF